MAFQDAANSQVSPARVGPFDTWLARTILGQLQDPPIRIVLCDGEEIRTNDAPALSRIYIGDRRTLLSVVFDPDMRFGEAYADGRVRIKGDLVGSLSLTYVPDAKPNPLRNLVRLLRKLQRRANTLDGSKSNIHYHYDLGNDFYKLWLDEEMSYTCGYFPTREATLEEGTWRLYVAGSAAAFRGSSLHLFQVTFSRGSNNEIPWTRAHLYDDA